MLNCKFCYSKELVKAGIVRKHQRYRCNQCRKYQIKGDLRLKYKKELRIMAICMYLENMGLRNIGRILQVPYQLVSKWIKNESFKYEKSEEKQEIEILEINELVTYIKKNPKKCGYGLLLTETETKLLILK